MSGRYLRFTGLGRALFAIGITALGVLILVYGNAALVLQAMPQGFPGRGIVMYACGAVMVGCGIGLYFARAAVLASRVLLVYVLLWLLVLKAPIVVAAPLVIGSWETFAETAVLLSGAWMIFATRAGPGRNRWWNLAAGERGVRWARILFGVALVLFGLAHFAYLEYTAALVPAWLAWHVGWASLTGAAYLAAGLGVLLRVYPRLAALLTTGMMSLFQLLVWVPKVAAAPAVQANWSELLVGWTLVFGAWVVTDSYRGVAWSASGKRTGAQTKPEFRAPA